MDVILCGATASLSLHLPRYLFGGGQRSPMAMALGLSLGLFSLSLLEASPDSWRLLLSSNDSSSSWLSISRAYWALLWSLAISILLVFPSLTAVAILKTFGQSTWFHRNAVDLEEHKKARYVWRSSAPWWIRFSFGLIKIVIKNVWRLMSVICPLSLLRRRTNEGLVLTVHDEEMIRRSGSTDHLEKRSLVAGSPKSSNNNPTSPSIHTGYRPNLYLLLLAGIVGIAVVLSLVRSLGPLVVHTSDDKNSLSLVVSWLCAVGLLLSSLMNGFGSVSMPYSCLAGLYLKPVPSEVIYQQEIELKSIQKAVQDKKATLREVTLQVDYSAIGKTSNQNNSKSGGFLAGVRSFTEMGDELGNRRRFLQTEIDFLGTLCQEMKDDIEELRYSQRQAAAARTKIGKLKSYVGLGFSALLLLRLASARWTIWKSYTQNTNRHRVAHGDSVTTSLLWLTGHELVSPKDLAMFSQIVSLALTAILSFTQVQSFLRTVAAVHRRLNSFYQKFYCVPGCSNRSSETINGENTTVGSEVVSQLVAGVTGCYFLSCIVLIKMMLPEEFCEEFATALGGTDVFTIHTSVVDTVFAASAAGSATILAMLFGIQRQNNLRHTTSTGDLKLMRGADAC